MPPPTYIKISINMLFVIISAVFGVGVYLGYKTGYDRCSQDYKKKGRKNGKDRY